jgi:uncharacterized DUF497 family protein
MVNTELEFEWDLLKDVANLKKHGCSFLETVESFNDPNGLQLVDLTHSSNEERHYWVGRSAKDRVFDDLVHNARTQDSNHWLRRMAQIPEVL